MNPNRRYDPADEPLWLIVERENQIRCFEFAPAAQMVVVVGSSDTADVRIRNAAPIAFSLERDGQSILLIPACPEAELRLDAVKVRGKRRIYTQGLVELGDVQLRLKVRETPPTLRGDGRGRRDSEISDPASKRLSATVDDGAATTTIDTSTVRASLRPLTTASVPVVCSISAMAFPTETLEFAPPNFDEWFEDAIAPTARTKSTPETTELHETANATSNERVDPHRIIEIAANCNTDLEPTKRTRRSRFETSRQTRMIQLGHVRNAGDMTDFEDPLAQQPEQSNGHSAAKATRHFPSPTAALERLGLLAMRRPWVVVTSAAAGSFLLVMLVIGVMHHLGHGCAQPSIDSGRYYGY